MRNVLEFITISFQSSFQDGSLYHSSGSWHSLYGNIVFASRSGSVNQGSSKSKHNKSEMDLYGRGTVLHVLSKFLLQTPTMFNLHAHYKLDQNMPEEKRWRPSRVFR